MIKTQIVKIEVKDLMHADWNYKTDGTAEQIEVLKNAIEYAGSCGVLMVRELESGKFEVMDGNHRLTAVRELGWGSVACENFGEIDKSKAIVLTRQRNEQWFEDDKLKLATLFKDDVLVDYSIKELEKILPVTVEELDNMVHIAEFEWTEPTIKDQDPSDNLPTIKIKVEQEVLNLWEKWVERLKEAGSTDNSKAIEIMLCDAMRLTEEEIAGRVFNV